MPNENARTARLIQILNSVPGCRAKKRHGGKFQQGDPDIAGTFFGHSFYIEVKLESGELTQLQATELEDWRESGHATTALAVWSDERRAFRIIRPHDSESWLQLAGKVKGVLKDSDGCPFIPMQWQDWKAWLDMVVRPCV